MENRTGPTRGSGEKIKLFSGPGTRRWPRFDISDIPSIQSVRTDTGREIKIINISRGGALLQSREHAAPGTRIQLCFATSQDVMQLSGLILRASIASPKGIPEFQAAVSFDRPLLIVDFPPKRDTGKPPAVSLKPPLPGPSLTDGSESLRQPYQDEASEIIAAFLAINFCKSPDAVQDEMLKLNDW